MARRQAADYYLIRALRGYRRPQEIAEFLRISVWTVYRALESQGKYERRLRDSRSRYRRRKASP